MHWKKTCFAGTLNPTSTQQQQKSKQNQEGYSLINSYKVNKQELAFEIINHDS